MAKLSDFSVLTFDCYGTLVDWESGMLSALQPLLTRVGADQKYSRKELLDIISAIEKAQQAKTPNLRYAELLTAMYPAIAAKLGDSASQTSAATAAAEAKAYGDSVGQWPAFPDSVEALKRLSKYYKLVILSNVDRDSFSRTNSGPLQGVKFDLIVTAQDVGSYKPDPRNFTYMSDKVQAEFGIPKDKILQTAQSQFHDHHPAKKAGIKSAWIARQGAVMGNLDEEIYDWKFNTLGKMADAREAEA